MYHDILLHAHKEKIFEAISTPHGFNAWWTQSCSGRLLEGELFNFGFGDKFSWWAYVAEVLKDKKVSYEFCDADKDWNDTLLSFEIISKRGTYNLLRFEHSNWKSTNDHYRRTNFCWAKYFLCLQKFLEQGIEKSHLEG